MAIGRRIASAMDPRNKYGGDSETSYWRTVITLYSVVIAGLVPAIHVGTSLDYQ
jgi:hypothetical protein